MRRLIAVLGMAAMVLAGSTAIAANGIVEDFEDGHIDGEWRWSGSDFVEPTGGNPGGYGRCPEIWVPTPVYFGGWDAPGWTGDYTAMGVTGFSIDIMTISTQNVNLPYYPLFIAIQNHMGTPEDITDDVFVFYDPDANNAPGAGTGWASYQWDIPSDFVGGPGELPPGWGGGNWTTLTTFPADMTWQEMMSNVGRLEIRMLYMDYAAVYEPYVMGADNVTLYYGSGPIPTESKSFGALKSLYR